MTTEAIKFALDVSISVEDVIRIARDAGKLLLERYNQSQTDICATMLAVNNMNVLAVSEQCVRGLVCMELTTLSPHVPIVSEDNQIVPYSMRKLYHYFWLIAPLDGGRAFTERSGQFTVNIALVRGRTPVLGVVYTPCEDITHWAVRGRGAFVRVGSNGPDEPIKTAEFSDCDIDLTIVASPVDAKEDLDTFVKVYREPTFMTVSSSIKFMMVADGRAHVYPRLSSSNEWDTCAAQIIVEEAGGEVLTLPDMAPLQYGKEETKNPHLVSYARRVSPPAPDPNDPNNFINFDNVGMSFDVASDPFQQHYNNNNLDGLGITSMAT